MTDKKSSKTLEICSLVDSIEQRMHAETRDSVTMVDKSVIIDESVQNHHLSSLTNSATSIKSTKSDSSKTAAATAANKIDKMSPGLAKRINTLSLSDYTESSSPISNQTSPGVSTNSSSASQNSCNSANLKIQFALEKNMQKLNLTSKNVQNSQKLTKEDIELFTNNEHICHVSNRNSAEREMTPDSIDENFYLNQNSNTNTNANTNAKSKKIKSQNLKTNTNKVYQRNKLTNSCSLNAMNNFVSASSTSSSISSSLSSPITNQQTCSKWTSKLNKNILAPIQQSSHLTPTQQNRQKIKSIQQPFQISRHRPRPLTAKTKNKKVSESLRNSSRNVKNVQMKQMKQTKQASYNTVAANGGCHNRFGVDHEHGKEEEEDDNDDDIDDDDDGDDEEEKQDEWDDENDNEYEDCDQDDGEEYQSFEANTKTKSKLIVKPQAVKSYTQSDFKYTKKPNIGHNNFCKQNISAFIQPKNNLNTSGSSSTSTLHSNHDSNRISTSIHCTHQKHQKLANTNSNSDRDFDTDEETNKLLEKQIQNSENEIQDQQQQCKNYIETKQKSRENQSIHQIMDPDNKVLIEGVLFRARYLGSTQLISDGNPTKLTRMLQAQEAVGRIKAPEGESQPSVEVDLFVSTEKIMVLNTDLQEIMMDHSLRSISYIADIGNLVVLMAKRRPINPDEAKRQVKMVCHVFESEEAQVVAQSIGQAFQVAYMEYLKANGIEDMSIMKDLDYQEVLNQQEIMGDELLMFAKKECQKEVIVPKHKNEPLGVVIVESGWGSMLPTVVVANMMPSGPAARCGHLNIGDQIISVNGISMVGLPLTECQNQIKSAKHLTLVRLVVVPCPPVVEVLIKRPDTKYQLGFSVQDGIICSLLRGGIAERGGVRVGHRIIEINNQSVVATQHEKIVTMLANSVGELRMKTMPTQMFRLLTGQELPVYI